MAKQTTKYVTACAVARVAKVPISDDQQQLYNALNERAWHWNSKSKEWENYSAIPANSPNPIIRIRVWADAKKTAWIANVINKALACAGLDVVAQTEPYPCRPPAQLESRIYLEFLPSQPGPTEPAPAPGDAVLGTPQSVRQPQVLSNVRRITSTQTVSETKEIRTGGYCFSTVLPAPPFEATRR